jgi:O-antigen ligase
MGTISVYQYYTKTFTNDYGGFAQAEIMQIVGASNDYRISGPIGDPNFFAQIMVALVPLALERFLNEKKFLLRLVAGWALIVSALSVVFTFSRGGFLALAVVVALYFLFYPPKPSRMPMFLIAAIVIMAFIPPSYYTRILSINELFGASDVGFRTNDLAIRGRASETLTAIEMFKDHPILGVGLKNYPSLYVEYSKSIGLAPSATARSPHNLYLETAAETGTIGVMAFGLILIMTLGTIKSARERFLRAGMTEYASLVTAFGIALLGYLTAAIFVHAAFPRFFYLLIGIGLALDAIAKKETAYHGPSFLVTKANG